ncbi:hypothetical protein IHV25_09620 [Phaeovibrio sulfidiphilus]|uniref:Tetratricopeptide repeat protein n=1 Tax=Phaeovibrio sulfidiphilus TaxID=1220600 RepID=A0A8J6YNK1_9PROT|nr:hypothetical protein [Phaeovibrio sulfidiphilus]MBE1237900.1 hypothetical protein [Phaeovibrio sulfidiphilus]
MRSFFVAATTASCLLLWAPDPVAAQTVDPEALPPRAVGADTDPAAARDRGRDGGRDGAPEAPAREAPGSVPAPVSGPVPVPAPAPVSGPAPASAPAVGTVQGRADSPLSRATRDLLTRAQAIQKRCCEGPRKDWARQRREAEAAFSRAISLNPRLDEAWVGWISEVYPRLFSTPDDAAFDTGWILVERRLKAALRVMPKRAELWRLLGDTLAARGSRKTGEEREALFAEGVDAFGKAARLEPDNAENQFRLAYLHKLRWDTEPAATRPLVWRDLEDTFARSRQVDPQVRGESWALLAQFRYEAAVAQAVRGRIDPDRLEDVETAIDTAIDTDFSNVRVWMDVGDLLMRRGTDGLGAAEDTGAAALRERAMKAYANVLKIEPASAEGWRRMVGALRAHGETLTRGWTVRTADLDRILEDMEMAARMLAQLEPENGHPWADVGFTYDVRARFADGEARKTSAREAEAYYRKAVGLQPLDASLWSSLGAALSRRAELEPSGPARERLLLEAGNAWDMSRDLF